MTNTDDVSKLGVVFWAVAILAIIWNGLGAMNLFMQMNPESLKNYPETHQALIASQPVWAKIGFALSVIGGLLGGIQLLQRKRVATYAFMISLLGTLLVTVHVIGSGIELSVFDIVLTIVMPALLAAFWTWFSSNAARNGKIS